MKKKSDKKQVSLLDKLKAIWQIKTVRTTLFFGFYFFFFLFLFLNFDVENFNKPTDNQNNSTQNGNENNITQDGNENDTNQNNNTQNNNSNPTKPTTWEFNTLINDNYSYTYTINDNGSNIVFEGRVSEPNDLVNDYQYNYFLNLYNINQITKNSKYLERVTLQEGYQYSYEISNKSLGELLESDNVLTSDKLNKITIYTNSNMVINKIELELTNLMQELNNYSNYQITLQYENR